MEENPLSAQHTSECAPPACSEAEASEHDHCEDLRLKDPKALDWWLFRVAGVICSGQNPEAALAYREHAISCGLLEQLERTVLIQDIWTSPSPVKERLARGIVFLLLNLQKDHFSDDTKIYLEIDQEDVLYNFQRALAIPTGVPPKRTKLDEIQVTSIVRGLLEVFGGREDANQDEFNEDYTASHNADLCASLFGIIRTNQFGDFKSEAMRNMLSKSQLFSGVVITEQDLEQWTANMKDRLCLGGPKQYLGIPSLVLNGFGVGQIDRFNQYLEKTYHNFPILQKPGNSVLLLLAWSNEVSNRSLQVLINWVRSEDGCVLYKRLVQDFQTFQEVEQLALIMAAMLNYRRLLPDAKDYFDQPINGSYLADLDALLDGRSLGNSGAVAEQMVLSLVRVLRSSTNQYEDLITFLETVLDRRPHLLCLFDEFSDEYLRLRISQPHQNALRDLLQTDTQELGGKNDEDWIIVPQLTTLLPQDCSQRPNETTPSPVDKESFAGQSHSGSLRQTAVTDTIPTLPRAIEEATESSIVATASPSSIQPNHYRLVRLSKIMDEHNSEITGTDIFEILRTKVQTMDNVYHVEELSDGSWELLVLDAHCVRLEATFGNILPGWDVDLVYDPECPTIGDLNHWNYATARQIRQHWFRERAGRIIEQDLYPAAAYYKYLRTRSLSTCISDKDNMEPFYDSLNSGVPSMKNLVVQSAICENDNYALPDSSHEATSLVEDLPLHATSVFDDLELKQVHSFTHKSNGSLYGDSTDRCDLQYPIVDSPEGKDWYAARMEHPSNDAATAFICYQRVLKILAEHYPVAAVRVPSASTFDNFMLARVFMAKQHNAGVEIGLAYRCQGREHVRTMTVEKFEDFVQRGVYFMSKPDIMCTIPSGQRWKTEFQSPELRSWLGMH